MAAPSHITLENLSGRWKLNGALSGDVKQILAIQGTNYMTRNLIASASVNLAISQPKPDEYQIKQTATAAGIPGTTEQYVLDNEWRPNHDAFFGDVNGRSKWVSIDEAEKLLPNSDGKWDQTEGRLIFVEGGSADEAWSAVRVWGFEDQDGQRRYTQRVKVWNKQGDEAKVKMVYDYLGPNEDK